MFANLACPAGGKTSSMEESEISETPTTETELLKELEKWKEKVEKTEKLKSEILVLTRAVDEKKRMRQKDLTDLMDESNRRANERMRIQENQKKQLSLIYEQNKKLKMETQILKLNLETKKMKCGDLTQSFSLKKCLPEKKMKFVHLKDVEDEDEYMNMCCDFHVATEIPIMVNQGEALIQFEEESVAQQLITKHSHIINLENKKVVLEARPVALKRGTTFELHVKISQTKIYVSNIPNVNIHMEWMRDKLELLFCKAKLGGIQNISYDPRFQMAIITFAQPIALNNIIRYGQCCIDIFGQIHLLTVSPVKNCNVEKVQMFSGTSKKTVLLTGINAEQKDENVEDVIEIHFQKPSNGGGEVEQVTYVPKGTKIAYFEINKGDFI
ncbi:N-myc-interactor [Python bivittatus]|uniref:N-myc-interactor n=1 Tax=Python bivittatus TaxID=176946 RepID=A0A9F3QSB7_PYTBI|nr:N-myc-interactor [Python bivittatus]